MTKKTFVSIIAGLCLLDIGLLLFITFTSNRPREKSSPTSTSTVSTNHLVATSPRRQNTITIRAVGDVMLGRSVATGMTKRANWRWPFEATMPKLKPTDIVIGNLEAPIVEKCPLTDSGMVFCTPPTAIEGLVFANFSVLSLANNHILNHGQKGLEQTEAILDKHKIMHLGHKQTILTSIHNIPVRFIAYDDVTYPLTKSDIETFSEITIVYIHWGAEYQSEPSSRQRLVASWLLERGAHIILGSHPHVLQPIEQPKPNLLVAYSLGNFVFDQMWSEATRKGTILDLKLQTTNYQLQTIHYTQTPITIHDYGQPQIDSK